MPVNGIWPVSITQPSASTAWLNGATGSGAPPIMWNVRADIGRTSSTMAIRRG